MLPFNKESCRSEAVHDRNLFNVFFPNGTQKVKVDIILSVTITYCLLVKDKMKILSLLETGHLLCSQVTLFLSSVVFENR